MRSRVVLGITLAGALLVLAPRASHGQAAVTSYTRSQLKPLRDDPSNPGQLDPRDLKRFDPASDIPLPIEPAEPERDRASVFRKVATLEDILSDPGAALIVRTQTIGASSSGTYAPHHRYVRPILLTRITSPDAARPDSSSKGKAFLSSGSHAREWQAHEALVRHVQRFQAPELDTNFRGTRDALRLGNRLTFFAENLEIDHVVLQNPAGILHTQDFHDKCHHLNVTIKDDTGLRKGTLRAGRLHRKNLRDCDEKLNRDSDVEDDPRLVARGHSDLRGVDLQSFELESQGSDDPRSDSFDEPARQGKFEDEVTAIRAALADRAGFQRGGSYTGAACLDIHAYAVDPTTAAPYASLRDPWVLLPDGANGRFLSRFFAERLVLAGAANFADAHTARGSIDNYVQREFGISAAAMELPCDPKIDFSYFRTDRVKNVRATEDLTQSDARFLMSEEALPPIVTQAHKIVDRALDFATGPPYLRQLVLVIDKGLDGSYDLNATGSKTQVLYWSQWVQDGAGRRLVPKLNAYAAGPRTLNALDRNGNLLPAGSNVRVRVILSFSKPMVEEGNEEAPVTLKLRGTLLPGPMGEKTITFFENQVRSGSVEAGSDRWISSGTPLAAEGGTLKLGGLRYERDSWSAVLLIPTDPVGTTVANAAFNVQAADVLGFRTDADPSTVAKQRDGEFMDYDDADPTGVDRSHGPFKIDSDPPRLER